MNFARCHLTNLTASQCKKITFNENGLTENAKLILLEIKNNMVAPEEVLLEKERIFIASQPKRTDALYDFHSRERRAVESIGGEHNARFYLLCKGIGCTPDGFFYSSRFRRLIGYPDMIIEVKSNLNENKSISQLINDHRLQIAFQQLVLGIYKTKFVVSYGKEERIETLDIVSDSETLEKVKKIIREVKNFLGV